MIRFFTAFATLAVIATAGCTFSRAVVNPHHTMHDTSWIIPGKTTRDEVISRLGMPPHVINGRGGAKDDTLRWVTADTFTATFEAGRFITPTLEKSRQSHRHDLLIKFAPTGTVELVSRTETVDGKGKAIDFREAR